MELRDAPLAGCCEFSDQAGAPSLLHFLRELPHGFLRDDTAFPARKGGSGIIESQEEFRTLALACLPQCQGFRHCVFFVVQPTLLNGSADECLLIRGKLYVHAFRVGRANASVKPVCRLEKRPVPSLEARGREAETRW